MKIIVAFIWTMLPFLLTAQVSIYDIQYTDAAVDGTYPSQYNGQTVTTGGIVTLANYNGGRYFIASSDGGAWKGVFIYDNNNSPSVGDSVILTGEVYEYNGMTEIKDLTEFNIVNSGNPIPDPTNILTANVSDEAYEAVLVKINNCAVTGEFDDYGNWKANDGSGDCFVRSGIYNLQSEGFPLFINYPFASIQGIVTDYYGSCLLPRFQEDIQSNNDAFTLTTPDFYVLESVYFNLPVTISLLNQSANITSYVLNMTYDSDIIEYRGFEKTGTISESGSITDNSTIGNISLVFDGDIICDDILTLIKLKFTALANGEGNLQFSTPLVNGNEIPYFVAGQIFSSITECEQPSADTLTIIQRPLLNIPSIITPGETLFIECFAPDNTTEWDATLTFNAVTVDLTISQSDYDFDLDKWTLQATIPSVALYELYDLNITASNGITDNVANAVKVIEQYKDDYYFVQITDTHLPGHTFWGDDGYDTDNSELQDFEEVIKDINLINPEFVLLTGDLLNEGEMEDFECLRHHTKAIELLQKFKVPVFIVPGNHDLGGWELAPPSQGTSHRDWWRFFGWRQRESSPTQPEYYVHDYSFDYGNVHFVGMEASVNYDNYMYEVYGEMGFIPSQLEWLENDLYNAGDKIKVLFYHFDFNDDIDLSTLGADMALWGHTHSNTDDFSHPYNIGTDNVCDGKSAYRIIRVNEDELTPESTTYAKTIGQNLEITYSGANNGTADSLEAVVINNHNQTFENAMVRFVMPTSNEGYTVSNGTLFQIEDGVDSVTCYVGVNLAANSETTVMVKKNGSSVSIEEITINSTLVQNFPNPFQTATQIKLVVKQRSAIKLHVYNTNGQLIKVLADGFLDNGEYLMKWDATDANGEEVEPGTYFCKCIVNGQQTNVIQMVYMK